MNAAKLSLEGGPAKRVDAKAEAVLAAAAGEGPEPRATLARLLHEGVSPGVSDEYGRQPLHHAAFGDALDAARILYDCGADNIIERSPAVAKQKARLLAGKRQKPLPPQLQACMDLLIAAQAEKRGGAVDAAAGFA
ncbi:hypothetical protein JL721_12817 [Aureococcus anophagefferens]|nr:hypothetical protein JL721_12817 [Aureococcus anophagefferens]